MHVQCCWRLLIFPELQMILKGLIVQPSQHFVAHPQFFFSCFCHVSQLLIHLVPFYLLLLKFYFFIEDAHLSGKFFLHHRCCHVLRELLHVFFSLLRSVIIAIYLLLSRRDFCDFCEQIDGLNIFLHGVDFLLFGSIWDWTELWSCERLQANCFVNLRSGTSVCGWNRHFRLFNGLCYQFAIFGTSRSAYTVDDTLFVCCKLLGAVLVLTILLRAEARVWLLPFTFAHVSEQSLVTKLQLELVEFVLSWKQALRLEVLWIARLLYIGMFLLLLRLGSFFLFSNLVHWRLAFSNKGVVWLVKLSYLIDSDKVCDLSRMIFFPARKHLLHCLQG